MSKGELRLKDYDDPFFVVDLGQLMRLCSMWKKNLPSVTPFYGILEPTCNFQMLLPMHCYVSQYYSVSKLVKQPALGMLQLQLKLIL